MAASKKRWGMLAIRLLGVLLLVYVLGNVNWRDSVILENGTEVTGEIVEELPVAWDADARVSFLALGQTVPTSYTEAELEHETIGELSVPVVNEGILRIVRRSHGLLVLLGILVFLGTSHFGVWRWWLLLRSQGVNVSFWLAHRLTFLGMFFNNVVPGATGGDLVKAVYLARHTERGAKSVATVLVDRITGIVALATIAAVAILTQLDNPDYHKAALVIFGFLGAFALGCVVFFSRRIRRVFRVDEIATKLPGGGLLKKLDDACFAYRDHKGVVFWAMVLSFANQIAIQAIMILFAHALNITTRAGEAVPITDYLVILPVGFMLAAIPALPGGWGVREGAFALFFHQVGVGRNAAVALSVMGGVLMVTWSLLGGIYFLLWRAGGERLAPSEVEDDLAHVDELGPASESS